MNDGDDGEEAGEMTEVTEKIERNHLELFGIASFVAKRRVLGWMYWGRRLAPGEKWSHTRSSSLTSHYSTVQPGPGNDVADLGYCEQTGPVVLGAWYPKCPQNVLIWLYIVQEALRLISGKGLIVIDGSAHVPQAYQPCLGRPRRPTRIFCGMTSI